LSFAKNVTNVLQKACLLSTSPLFPLQTNDSHASLS
jgi:hypothetical protein